MGRRNPEREPGVRDSVQTTVISPPPQPETATTHMKTKFTTLLLLTAALFTGATLATAAPGEGRGPGGSPEARIEKMREHLKLTDAQVEQLRPIFQAQLKEIKSLREETTLTQDEKREEMRAILEKYRPQIGAVLTEEQKQKFADARGQAGERGAALGETRRERRPQTGAGGTGSPTPTEPAN
jgi:Spy/CpxP family protein refolding chaperone